MRWVVVKMGGGLANHPEVLSRVVRTWRRSGSVTWASSWFTVEDLKRQNYPGDWLETRMVGGRRVTCEDTLEVMKMVLSGRSRRIFWLHFEERVCQRPRSRG